LLLATGGSVVSIDAILGRCELFQVHQDVNFSFRGRQALSARFETLRSATRWTALGRDLPVKLKS